MKLEKVIAVRTNKTVYRDGDKVRSDYLRADEVEVIRAKINRRHELVAALKEQQRSQKQIEKALGRVPNVE